MKRILLVFGTRPEAIKMAPLFHELRAAHNEFDTRICVTAQHREMLDQVLSFFNITPEYDLKLMRPNQTLHNLTAEIISGLKPILDNFVPDVVLVHGDTTTSTAAALASFYSGIKVGHVEAGLRTYDKKSPFPEEVNRQLTGRIADYHFAPTLFSKQNLISEKVSPSAVVVTGNTVIDALFKSVEIVNQLQDDPEIAQLKTLIQPEHKLILVTGHRRENHGQGFLNICSALKTLAKQHSDATIVYPVHLNPKVKKPVYELLEGIENIHLIAPLSYPAFVWLMDKSYLILTDSGGVQEEAPSLGKPVLVMRDTTERPEAVDAGTVLLVGTNTDKIIQETQRLLLDRIHYNRMSTLSNPYGDGKACQQIVEFLKKV